MKTIVSVKDALCKLASVTRVLGPLALSPPLRTRLSLLPSENLLMSALREEDGPEWQDLGKHSAAVRLPLHPPGRALCSGLLYRAAWPDASALEVG